MERIAEGLSLRSTTAADEPFLAEVYRSTREDLASLQADPALMELLLRQQRDAQTRGYALIYPQAQYLLVEQDGVPLGRVVVDFGRETVHLVDISLVPAARGHGHGTAVLRWLQRRAATAAQPLTLRVQHGAVGAARLYAALGFAVVARESITDLMMWKPES